MKRLGTALFALALVACGGAAGRPAPSTPPAGDAMPVEEPATIEEASAQIAQAEAAIARQDGFATGGALERSDPTTASTPADNSRKTEPERPATSGACVTPCRAIRSMRSAVAALCRMTGDEDARCVDAKQTLTASEAKVAPCGC